MTFDLLRKVSHNKTKSIQDKFYVLWKTKYRNILYIIICSNFSEIFLHKRKVKKGKGSNTYHKVNLDVKLYACIFNNVCVVIEKIEIYITPKQGTYIHINWHIFCQIHHAPKTPSYAASFSVTWIVMHKRKSIWKHISYLNSWERSSHHRWCFI